MQDWMMASKKTLRSNQAGPKCLFTVIQLCMQINNFSAFEIWSVINTLYDFSSEGEMFRVGSYKWGF